MMTATVKVIGGPAAGSFYGSTLGGVVCDDLAIGVPFEDSSETDNGALVVLYSGGSSGIQTSSPADQYFDQDFGNLEGTADSGDAFGNGLAIGRFNNDGYDDLAVSVPGESAGGGAVQLVLGGSNGLSGTNDILLDQDSTGIAGVVESDDQFGWCVGYGDYNDDGVGDLAVCIPNEDATDYGEAAVVYLTNSSTIQVDGTSDTWLQSDLGTANEQGDEFPKAITEARRKSTCG